MVEQRNLVFAMVQLQKSPVHEYVSDIDPMAATRSFIFNRVRPQFIAIVVSPLAELPLTCKHIE